MCLLGSDSDFLVLFYLIISLLYLSCLLEKMEIYLVFSLKTELSIINI